MDEKSLRQTTLSTLQSIAPEIDPSQIVPGRALRSQVDLDSMDWLNFLVALNEKLKVEIPEADYARLATIDDIVAYLSKRLASK